MKLKDYEVYLFDWDGTLVSSHDMWLEIIRSQLGPRDIYLSDEEIVRQLFGRYDTGMRELGFSDVEIDRLGTELETAAKQKYLLVELFPKAREVLETLKRQGKKQGLVTATFREVVDVAIGNHDLLDLFDVTVSGDEAVAQKPHPSGILIALKKLGIAPDRAIMCGDSPKDLLAGSNAGTDTLLFYPPEHETQHSLKELQVCNPTYTFRNWQEVLDRLQ